MPPSQSSSSQRQSGGRASSSSRTGTSSSSGRAGLPVLAANLTGSSSSPLRFPTSSSSSTRYLGSEDSQTHTAIYNSNSRNTTSMAYATPSSSSSSSAAGRGAAAAPSSSSSSSVPLPRVRTISSASQSSDSRRTPAGARPSGLPVPTISRSSSVRDMVPSSEDQDSPPMPATSSSRSGSRASIGQQRLRLGDTLLRKVSPSGRKAKAREGSTSGRNEPMTKPSVSSSRSSSNAASMPFGGNSNQKEQKVTSSRFPMAPPSQSSGPLLAEDTDPSMSSAGGKGLSHRKPSQTGVSAINSDVVTSSFSTSPSLPNFDSSLHAPLFEGAGRDQDSNRSSAAETVPFNDSLSSSLNTERISDSSPMADHRRDPSASYLPPLATNRNEAQPKSASRKPNFHLSFDRQTIEPPSRFSAFSSAYPTPDVSDGGTSSGRAVYHAGSGRGRPSEQGSSPEMSRTGSNSTAATPAQELSHSSSGLGIGPSPASGATGLSPSNRISSTPNHSRSRTITGGGTTLTVIPHTPDRRADRSPRPSPSQFDRAGQIGIGELATPKWNFTSSSTAGNSATWGSTDGTSASERKARPSAGNTSYRRQVAPESPTTWSTSNSAAAVTPRMPSSSTVKRQKEAEAKRHSRAISLSLSNPPPITQRSPSGPPGQFVTSPSMPFHSTLSSLARDFGQNPGDYMRNLRELSGGAGGTDSPAYSIDARSESEASPNLGVEEALGIANSITKKDRAGTGQRSSHEPAASPSMGDLAWSPEETGPFAVSARNSRQVAAAQGGIDQAPTRTDAALDPFGSSSSLYHSDSFDLNKAIADLLKEDEERRSKRAETGASDSEAEGEADQPVPFSSVEGGGRPSSSTAQSAVKADASFGSSTASTTRKASMDFSRVQSLRSSSPQKVVGSDASPPVATPSRTSRAAATTRSPAGGSTPNSSVRHSKRASSSSIGHSLLRGSLPFGVDSSYDSSEATEALRQLDGLNRKGSGSRERPSHDGAIGSSKSPRASKSYSRPSSAGKGSTSRGTSPSGNRSYARLSDASGLRSDRQRTSEEGRSRRSSRTMSKARVDELASPKVSLDTPMSPSSAMSPRHRKTALPPLPTQQGYQPAMPAAVTSSPGTPATSKRTSAVSMASRESVSKDAATPPTTASRMSSSSRNKRISDGSSIAEPAQGIRGADGSGSTSFEESDPLRSQTQQQHQTSQQGASGKGDFIPPVPPLPKGWDSHRSVSYHSSSDLPSPSMGPTIVTSSPSHATCFIGASKTVASPRSPAAASMADASMSDDGLKVRTKWGLSKASGSASRSPTHSKFSASGDDGSISTGGIIINTRRSSRYGDFTEPPQSPAESMTRPFAETTTFHSSSYSEESMVDSINKVGGKTPASPSITSSSRRTPSSFFRRRSEALGGSKDIERSPALAATQTTPAEPSGRSSRKSILGLGSLLRGSNRKSLQVSRADEQASSMAQADSEAQANESGSSRDQQRGGSTSRLKLGRRGSLMGRKRGKTLPSSADPPVLPGAQLPPMQMSPLPDSPALAAVGASVTSPLKKEFAMIDPSTYESPSIRRRALGASSSSGELLSSSRSPSKLPIGSAATISAGQQKAAQPTLDDISRSFALDDSASIDSGRSGNQPSSQQQQQSSRIPRATGIPVRQTPLRPLGGPPANGASGTSYLPKSGSVRDRQLSSYGGSTTASGLPKSTTMSSLAATLGMAAQDADRSGAPPTPGRNTFVSPSSSSHSNTLQSNAVTSIINAFSSAKTQSELEGALRRARIQVYSGNLSASDRETLTALIQRHEQKKDSDKSSTSVSNTVAKPAAAKARVNEVAVPRSRLTSTVGQPSAATTVAAAAASIGAGTSQKETPVRRTAAGLRSSVSATPSSSRAPRDGSLGNSVAGRSSRASAGSTLFADSRPPSATPNASAVDEDERLGDEEMEAYIRRSHQKKRAAGVPQAELDAMLRFPDPEPPGTAYSPRQAEALYGRQLSDYELEEMFDYPEVFYVGNAREKKLASKDKPLNNFGYDDERGDYLVIEHDHLAYRYEIIGTLGRGSFGQVLQCKDHKTGKSVAIKLIRNKKRFHHQALVEVKILENLVKWDPEDHYNVIQMTDSFYFRNHLCISMELLSINLYELIKANSFAGFSTGLIRRFASQVLASLALMKQNRVVHCDLKPENILLRHPRKSGIKVIDFGSSCFEYEKVYTYIQSRFYRSPEVIMGMNYHTAIDIWSLGCILAELYTGYPLFPGENEQEQLACIMEILGLPDRHLIERCSRKKLFFDSTGSPRPVVNSKGKRRKPGTRSLAQALKCNEELFIDFLGKCLVWDPERRIKPEGAMKHPFIRGTITSGGSTGHAGSSSLIAGRSGRQAGFASSVSSQQLGPYRSSQLASSTTAAGGSLEGGGGGGTGSSSSTIGSTRTARQDLTGGGESMSSSGTGLRMPLSGLGGSRRTSLLGGGSRTGGGGTSGESNNGGSTLRRSGQAVS